MAGSPDQDFELEASWVLELASRPPGARGDKIVAFQHAEEAATPFGRDDRHNGTLAVHIAVTRPWSMRESIAQQA